jgi:multidrug transporter EmrE-like cation transporter
MSISTLSLILISVTLSAVAQILFKYGVTSVGLSNEAGTFETAIAYLLTPGVIFGLALYGVGTILWLSVLARIDVSQAYPFVGVGFLLTAIFGVMLFGDHLSILRVVGMMIIVCGIYLVARG